MWRGRNLGVTSMIAAIVALALVAGPVFAHVYGINYGAGGVMDPTAHVSGLKGTMSHVPATTTAGHGIAHPNQIQSGTTTDFVGWGTMKGTANVAGCPNYVGAGWKLYIDGYLGNAYFCRQQSGTLSDTASAVFKIAYDPCPFYPYDTRWVTVWAGVVKDCQAITGSWAEFVSSGGESVTGNNEEIAVFFDDLQWRQGTTWNLWSALDVQNADDPPMHVTKVNDHHYFVDNTNF